MTKIYILIALLPQLFYTLIHGQESPCPQYFTYIMEPGTNETIGQIEIQSPPKTGELHLKATLKVAAILPISNTARLEVARSPSDVLQNSSMLYYVYFPSDYPIPELIEIWFNDKQYCSAPDETENSTTFMTLEKKLLWSEMTWSELLNMRTQKYNLNVHVNENVSSIDQLNVPNLLSTLQNIGTQEIVKFFQNISSPQLSLPDNFLKFQNMPNQNAELVSTPIPMPISIPTSVNSIPQDIDDDDSECGINNFVDGPNLLIVNGNETSQGRWPWLVALLHRGGEIHISSKEEGYMFLCAGSILTNKHIITAAHCLIWTSFDDDITYRVSKKLLVSLGKFNLTDRHEKGNIHREVASFKIHPDYKHTHNGDSDLAILILRTPIEYSSFIKPICLWTGSTKLEKIVNKIGHVVGWGRDELGNSFTVKPKMVNVPIVSQEICLWSHPVFRHLTSNRTFCAGFLDQTGPCNGDSGSGLILFDDFTDRYRLRGVVSRSTMNNQEMCDLKKYIVYVDVAKYVPWIREQISSDS